MIEINTQYTEDASQPVIEQHDMVYIPTLPSRIGRVKQIINEAECIFQEDGILGTPMVVYTRLLKKIHYDP